MRSARSPLVLALLAILVACTRPAPSNADGLGGTTPTGGQMTAQGGVASISDGGSSAGGADSASGGDFGSEGGLPGGSSAEANGGAPASAGSGGSIPDPGLAGCELRFPYQDEPGLGTWLGGDSAYSTPLGPTRTLWSFQDTFVGDHGQNVRPGAKLIANSSAIIDCQGGVGTIHYYWRSDAGNAAAIFSDGTPDQRFWPQQPIIYQGYLFAAMTRVQGGANEIGTTLARVSNPYDAPNRWHAEYFELASLPGLGKGTVVVDNYVYLFGSAGEALVTRLPLDELIKPQASPKALLEYLAEDGQWKPGLDSAAAKKLGFAANVGTSFRYLKGASKWLVLFTDTSGWPSADIAVSTAPTLEGPWSKPVHVFKVPEMVPGSPEYDPDNVCYAAVEHPESNAAPETELLFSYTCNSLVFEKQLANMSIYLPKFVKLKNPISP